MGCREELGTLPWRNRPGVAVQQQAGGKVHFVIHYRTFRNDDPPGLVEVWNEAFTQRGAVRLHHSTPLEHHVLAKPYFDRAGLMVAVEDGRPVGFAHAGFGPDAAGAALSTAAGVTCVLGVRPSHRRRGIGTELLRRCEDYLTERGAKVLYAGGLAPLNPFYFGLYGGSASPGFLRSDADAEPFLTARRYRPAQGCLVFQRRLDGPVNVVDGRFPELRRRFEVAISSRGSVQSWWRECVLGPVEALEFRLDERATGKVAARLAVWDMEGFWQRWNQPVLGIIELEVREDLRRQGLAKLLLSQVLRQLQEQFFTLAEIQTAEGNEAAVKLFRGLGFAQVDSGRSYRREKD
jgi:ribosomal protein S18 acetylase RimI-like enzyme